MSRMVFATILRNNYPKNSSHGSMFYCCHQKRQSPLLLLLCDAIRHQSYHSYAPKEQLMTAQEVATALRPFFFVIHPDRFWKYPKQKDTNEDSLKQLNSFIKDVIEMRETNDRRIKFFMRDEIIDNNEMVKSDNIIDVKFKEININLFRRENVNKIVHKILSESRLSTDYLKKIGKQPQMGSTAGTEGHGMTSDGFQFKYNQNSGPFSFNRKVNDYWVRTDINGRQTIETDPELDDFEELFEKKKIDKNLIEWLQENRHLANSRLHTNEPIRQELNRLADQLKQELHLNDIIWKDCGWGVSHIRAALNSVNIMKQQFDINVLNGRTLMFARQSGVSFDGHVVLNIEDVRHNWLAMIKNIHTYDADLKKLPFVESVLSGALRGIQIDHRKFRPTVIISSYIKQLEKLTAAISLYIGQHGFPPNWSPILDRYQLVVECEAGPLMLSPTGQFIVPASCPAFLLFDFMSDNMFKARLLRDMYLNYKSKEEHIVNECMTQLGLQSIDKDDNVTPDLMIQCCNKLIANRDTLSLRNSRLRVSHYYSVLLDGEICIPWDFTL
ncbi:T-cell activation inhibitor, mitochondrial-like [Oppia nitens]|uniref:T-cell activation inhibitor, mitochondrial-like n=1 Tax=Oppia nitens TaxID=1686743 RepID=UPI0023DCAF05|nr:T-cell activation inhibitor, mitochondrial-like [Oppia nitens]